MDGAGTVLVIGATGFFGGHIRRALEEAGFPAVAADRSTGGDLLDPAGLEDLIGRTGPATVINAAGITSPAAAMADPATAFATNATGVANLLEAVRRRAPGAHVIALSSAAVYAGEAPFAEESRTGAETPYAASKLAMEVICGQYSRWAGIPVTVLRCFNLIGPGEPATQASSEFTLAAIAAGPGGSAEIRVGNPRTSRDFTDVRDAARAVVLAAQERADGTFNLCSGRSTSLSDLARMVGAASGAEIELTGSGDGRPASGLLEIRGEGKKLRAATGWEPWLPLETSLRDLYEWRRAGA